MRALTVLGIETSCDETAASIVRGLPPGPGEILSNVIASQTAMHQPYGGVVPELAARAHVEIVDDIIRAALKQAGIALKDVDAIAATAGPGLIGGVMVGLTTAKALALAAGKDLIAVNHLEAHALTARLTAGVAFPFLLLLISGGHCQLMAAEGIGRYRLFGATLDDAVGEAFDKTAKLLGLPYPGGPQIEEYARTGNSKAYALPRPMFGKAGCDFSFSGLKTAVRQIVDARSNLERQEIADIAASFQATICQILVNRTHAAMQQFRTSFGKKTEALRLVVAGGVAANEMLRIGLEKLAAEQGFTLNVPPPGLCTDNGAMIAWAGLERLALGRSDVMSFAPRARWPLEENPTEGLELAIEK